MASWGLFATTLSGASLVALGAFAAFHTRSPLPWFLVAWGLPFAFRGATEWPTQDLAVAWLTVERFVYALQVLLLFGYARALARKNGSPAKLDRYCKWGFHAFLVGSAAGLLLLPVGNLVLTQGKNGWTAAVGGWSLDLLEGSHFLGIAGALLLAVWAATSGEDKKDRRIVSALVFAWASAIGFLVGEELPAPRLLFLTVAGIVLVALVLASTWRLFARGHFWQPILIGVAGLGGTVSEAGANFPLAPDFLRSIALLVWLVPALLHHDEPAPRRGRLFLLSIAACTLLASTVFATGSLTTVDDAWRIGAAVVAFLTCILYNGLGVRFESPSKQTQSSGGL